MRTIISVKNQTVFDIAVQHYGNVDLFDKIIVDNPHLVNDYSEASAAGVSVDYNEFDLSWPLQEGLRISIDPSYANNVVLRELKGVDIVSFDNKDLT